MVMKITPSKIRYITKSSMALATIVLFAGCKVGPDYMKPDVTVPQEFREQSEVSYASDAASIADLPWWNLFEDQVLVDLIKKSLANNYDLKVAVARIEQQRALV